MKKVYLLCQSFDILSDMKIVVIIPTYNEAENIKKMIRVLFKEVFPKIKNHRMSLLVVDDFSPDKTGEIVKKFMKKNKNIHLLEKRKEGLGAAYIQGFKYAIDKLLASAIIEMDADFQHNPKDIIRMVKSFEDGFDCVLGSRFTKGGHIPKDWGIKRVFLSVGGNFFIKTLLGISRVCDLTTGFRLTRVKGVLDKINFSKLYSKSYAYKIHLLYEIMQRTPEIKEIPIVFISRKKGWSKMDSADFIESLNVVIKIRLISIWSKIAGFAITKN